MPSVKVISVTPAGRRRYISILAEYLLRQREILAEHHFWLNTDDPEDLAYLEDLARRHPDFFKLKRRPVLDPNWFGTSIWQYFQDYTDPDTVYIRLDDDICYAADDAISALVRHRLADPKPFLIYGNIVNNALCSYIQQKRGLIPEHWGCVQNTCFDYSGWRHARFAARLHALFLGDLRRGREHRWRFPPVTLADYRRFSVNVICWYGHDMRQVPELAMQDLRQLDLRHPLTGEIVFGEEGLLSEYLPATRGRPNVICGSALFAHYAFFTQRDFLDSVTVVLDRYRDVANGRCSMGRSAWRQIAGMMKLASSSLSWQAVTTKSLRLARRFGPRRTGTSAVTGASEQPVRD